MSRLIDADALLQKFNDKGIQITFDLPVEEILGEDVDIDDFIMLVQDAIQAYKKMVIGTIQEQPTAYDVEKVVAELKRNMYTDYTDCDYVELEVAIDIVKRGGIDISSKWESATQQAHALNEAYMRGMQYERDKFAEWQDNNGWIPVSDRLPENNKVVLCWVTSTTIASGETFIIGSCDRGFWFLQTYEIGHHHFPVKDYKVVAWQPLPDPYIPKQG